jgi:hypothetical protein
MRSIIFTHIERTAGSTIHAGFRAVSNENWHVVDGAPALKRLRICGPSYIGGHFSLDDVERLAGVDIGASVNFATVRQPVERIVSLYAYIRTERSRNPRIWDALNGGSLTEFLDVTMELNPDFIRNAQCARFGSSRTFEDAKAVIAAQYRAVGTVDRLDDLVKDVAEAAGWKEPQMPAVPLNAAGFDDHISSGLRSRIEELTSEDTQLFQFLGRECDGLWRP